MHLSANANVQIILKSNYHILIYLICEWRMPRHAYPVEIDGSFWYSCLDQHLVCQHTFLRGIDVPVVHDDGMSSLVPIKLSLHFCNSTAMTV